MMKIPKGAKIIDARIVSPDQGTTGALNVGIASDPDYLYAAADLTAALDSKMLATVAGYEVELSQEETIILTATAGTDAFTGKISLQVYYTLD